MKLYNKNLTSLKALRRERAMKQAEANISIKDMFGQEGSDDIGATEVKPITVLMDLLTSHGLADKLLALSIPAMKIAGRKLERSFLKNVIKEVLLAYVKWKLVEFAFKTAKDRVTKDF